MDVSTTDKLKSLAEKRRGKPKVFLNFLLDEEIDEYIHIPREDLPDALGVFGNGGDWCRDDAWKRYGIKIHRHKYNGAIVELSYEFISVESFTQQIRPDISSVISKDKCVSCGTTSDIEVDHKNGRKNGPEMDINLQVLNHFQPLCGHCNKVKRERCKKCEESDKRFDARDNLYYTTGWIEGEEDYQENIGCVGCYWYDPKKFKERLGSLISTFTF